MWRQLTRQLASRKLFPSTFKRRFSLSGGRTAIPNEGSTARDHLANERTFLAWARTSLVFVGSGVGLHQFYLYNLSGSLDEQAREKEKQQMKKVKTNVIFASSSLVIVGGGILTFATTRYFSVLKSLSEGMFIPNTRGIAAFYAFTSLLVSIGLFTTIHFPKHLFPNADQSDNAFQ